MAKKIHNVKPVTVDKGSMRLELNTERLNRNLNDAQFALDSAIMTSMQPFMPMDTGQFIDRVKTKNGTLAGTGEVYAAVGPEGRFLYEGYVMVDSVTGKGPMVIPNSPGESILRFRKGAKLKPSNRKISYYRGAHRQATDHWFEAAKKKDEKVWMRAVDQEMNNP